MPTGRTEGSKGSQSPIPQTPPAPDSQQTGQTSSRRTVRATEPQPQMPPTQRSVNSKKLGQRQIKRIEVLSSSIASFIAWIRRRPKPSDIYKAEQLAHNLASREVESEATPNITFKNGKITLAQGGDKNSAERKALMILTKAGLAKIKSGEPFGVSKPDITFELVRPRNFDAQQQRAELLADIIPEDLKADQLLKWEDILLEIPPFTRNNLKISGIIIPDDRRLYIHGIDKRLSRYRSDQCYGSAEAHFMELQGQRPILDEGSPPHWQERFKQLKNIAPSEAEPLIKKAITALGKPVTRETLNTLMDIELELYDIHSGLAYEVKSAQKALYSNESLKPSPEVIRLDRQELTPLSDNWQSIKPFLEALGLFHNSVHSAWLEQLQEQYKDILPINLKDLAYEASLMEKEQQIIEYGESHMQGKRHEGAGSPSLRLDSQKLSPKKARKEVQDSYSYLHEMGHLRGSSRVIAEKMQERKPVVRLNYDAEHWQRAYERLKQQ